MTSPAFRDRDAFPGIQLHLVGADRNGIAAEQVGLFLFDFTVAFELFRSVVQSRGAQRLTKWDLYRGHRRVAPLERLAIQRIRMESPLEVIGTMIALSGGGAAATWAAVQAIERIYMLPLNRRKAELEIRKLEVEIHTLERAADDAADTRLRARADVEPTKLLPSGGRNEHSGLKNRQSVAPMTMLDDVVRGPVDEPEQQRQRHGDGTREVLETAQRRLLRNPIQVKQLELEFKDNLQPPAG